MTEIHQDIRGPQRAESYETKSCGYSGQRYSGKRKISQYQQIQNGIILWVFNNWQLTREMRRWFFRMLMIVLNSFHILKIFQTKI